MNNALVAGWAIFRKSISQIFYNLGDAVRLSAPLWILLFCYPWIFRQLGSSSSEPNPAMVPVFIGLVLVLFICTCWVATLWHRFMLLEEHSESVLPSWRGDLVWSFIKYAIIVGLAVWVIGMIPMLLIMLLLGKFITSSILIFIFFSLLMGAFIYYISLRFGLVLPAAALGKPITVGDSLHKTKSANGAIMIASLLLAVFTFAIEFVVELTGLNQITLQISSFVTAWVSMMLGISILTTLYGYLVEDRELG